MANGGGYFTIRDWGNEVAAFSYNTGVITAGNLAGVLTKLGTLRDAIDPIILGVVAEEGLYVFRSRIDNSSPSDVNAQRERKFLIRYEDNTDYFDAPTNSIPNAGFGKIFTAELPTADLSAVTLFAGTDLVDISASPVDDFVAAFEDLVKSPYGGSAHIVSMTHVGRNT